MRQEGPNGHGLVKYFNYDARGHAGRKVDTPNDLSFLYDRAERLVRVRESWGQQRVLKSFVFAESNGTDDWRNGKLWKANRYHYDVSTSPEEPPGALIFADGFESGDTSAWDRTIQGAFAISTEYEVRIRETYTYGGEGGRVSKRVLDLILNAEDLADEEFTQSLTYDNLGGVAELGSLMGRLEADAPSTRSGTSGGQHGRG